MEIEAKFRVEDDTIFPQLLQLRQIGIFFLTYDLHAENQRNTYFDTYDRRLRAEQYGLRVRDLGNRRIATLKSAARANDGMYERDEWEIAIGDDDQPSAWPVSEARDRALALLHGAEILPILTIQTHRQHIFATYGMRKIAELSLDTGTIYAGNRSEFFRELEVELLPDGTRADLDTLISLLRERFSLLPENQSKLARGLALLDAAE